MNPDATQSPAPAEPKRGEAGGGCFTSRKELARAVVVRPPRRSPDFGDGGVADAFLAAQVEHLCVHAGLRPPRWVRDPCYILYDPWFPGNPASPHLRALLIRDAHPAFHNRNLFTTSEITWRPKRGRPRLRSAADLAEANRLRQQRWRDRQRELVGQSHLTLKARRFNLTQCPPPSSKTLTLDS